MRFLTYLRFDLREFRWRFSVFRSRWRRRLHYITRAPHTYRNWWAIVLPKLGMSVVLRLRSGVRFRVRSGTSDLAVVNELAMANAYLETGFDELPADAIVMDVGANIGAFALQMAHSYPTGRVYAVEPVDEHCVIIEAQKRLNSVANVTSIHLALGGREGETAIHLEGSSSSSVWASGKATGVENVRQTTLPVLMAELGISRLDLLKLDCEGAEWDIIPAAEEVLPRIRRIAMEFHCTAEWTAERLADWLRARGYNVRHTPSSWNGMLWAERAG